MLPWKYMKKWWIVKKIEEKVKKKDVNKVYYVIITAVTVAGSK